MKNRILNLKVLLLLAVFVCQPLNGQEIDKKPLRPNKKIDRKAKVLSNTAMIRLKKEAFSQQAADGRQQAAGSGNYDYVVDRLRLDASITIGSSFLKPAESMTFNSKLKKRASLQANIIPEKVIEAEEPLLRTYKITYSGDETPEAFCKKLLRDHPEIEIAEPCYLPKIQAQLPNDPHAPSQELLTRIKLIDAWEIEEGDTNVVIGISDSGVDQFHEDLLNSIAINLTDPVNGVDDDENGYVDDYMGFDLTGERDPPDNTFHTNSHGTNVAGIATATVNNGIGIAGAANKCRFFPLRCSKTSSKDDIDFGYESITYAAIRGFKVLNCSWGGVKPYSDIDQSIINFAVAHDVAIVASGGNKTGSLEDNYPSAYDNVLAVGQVDNSDIFSGDNIGDYMDILAPGKNWYTDKNNGYSNSGSGSSYSAPVVAGVVALIRSKYPELDALQSLELARQSTDDISELPGNALWKDILPGRINALKAVTRNPFSIPSIRPTQKTLKNSAGIISNRFGVADTVTMTVNAFNYLGAADNLKFILSAVWDEDQSIEVIDSILNINHVDSDSELILDSFTFVKKKEISTKIFFRIDIFGESNYHDFFILEFIPSPIVTTFSNEAITFSASDRGTIGFGGAENSSQGVGFIYRDRGNQIWKAAFLASDAEDKVVSSVNWNNYEEDRNDFNLIKPLVPPDRYTGVFDDSRADLFSRIGFEVQQQFIIPQGDIPIAMVNIEVTNTTEEDINSFSSGYYFDWDLLGPDFNSVKHIPNAIPGDFQGLPASAVMIYAPGEEYPVCGNAVISFDITGEAQAAGMVNNIHSMIDFDDQLIVMKSGTSIEDFGISDCSIFTGMRFPEAFEPGTTKKYSICFGCAESEAELIEQIKMALDTTPIAVDDYIIKDFDVKLFPQPAGNNAMCVIESPNGGHIDISVFNLTGGKLISINRKISTYSTLSISLDFSHLLSGTYILQARVGNSVKSIPFAVIK